MVQRFGKALLLGLGLGYQAVFGLTLAAKVKVTENLGHEYLVFTETALGPITLRIADRYDCPEEGQELIVSLPRPRLHVFDAATGERIEIEAAE
jgi:ABC-type sugar transport system ATPase subunit